MLDDKQRELKVKTDGLLDAQREAHSLKKMAVSAFKERQTAGTANMSQTSYPTPREDRLSQCSVSSRPLTARTSPVSMNADEYGTHRGALRTRYGNKRRSSITAPDHGAVSMKELLMHHEAP
eukprot:GHVO01066813.1.p1 GENE.GHVO01066813.1~~GHVO01066813.1.p1  ORF type:complete len:139 (-),score=21.02 GHVO01066813.1:200-565(-)